MSASRATKPGVTATVIVRNERNRRKEQSSTRLAPSWGQWKHALQRSQTINCTFRWFHRRQSPVINMKDSHFLHLSRNDTYLEVKRRKQKRRQMDDFIVQYKRSKKIKTRLWKQELLANTSKLIHFSMDKQSVAITARWLPTKRLVVNVTFYDSWRLHFQRKSTHAHKQW